MAADGSGGWVNRGGPEPAGRRHDVILPGGYDSEYANNTGQSIRPRTLERGSSTEGTSIRRAPPPPAVAEAAVRPLFIEGYTTSVSYAPGETVFFCVSTSAPSFAATVHRVGAVRTLVWASPENKPLPGTSHEVPEDCSSTGCGWPVTFAVPVGNDWESGYYEATLHAEDDGGEFSHRGRRTADGVAHFIVRAKSSRPKANILLQLATNTYAAYNNYGGTCFCTFLCQLADTPRCFVCLPFVVGCVRDEFNRMSMFDRRRFWPWWNARPQGVLRSPMCWALLQVVMHIIAQR